MGKADRMMINVIGEIEHLKMMKIHEPNMNKRKRIKNKIEEKEYFLRYLDKFKSIYK